MVEHGLDLLKHIRGEIRFESGQLSSRLNTFIASQSFLLIAYASAMSGAFGQRGSPFALLFPPLLALLGFILSLQAWPGIKAALAVIEGWFAKQEELFARAPDLGAYRLGGAPRDAAGGSPPDGKLRQGVSFATHAPWIFAPAWCCFGALSLWLQAAG